jgi:N-acetylglucosamine kinase-like BadF-type ATPase
MSVYVGLDCGGSSSRVLAVDDSGAIVFQGQSGAANLVSTPEPRLRRNLLNATRGCAQADFVCGCFAGLLGDETRLQAEGLLRQMFPGSFVRAEPDYTAAFYSSPPQTDVCVIAGTGSLVCSRGENGVVKSGGRGYILGDFGSGFHYGRDALLHYLDYPRSSSTALRNAVLDVFGTDQESKIVSSLYKSGTAPQVLGRLARVLGADATAGESYAIASLERNTRALTDVVRDHVTRFLKPSSTLSVSLAGGMWKGAPIFKSRFQEILEEQLPGVDISVNRISKPPLYGALELAKELRIGN